MAERPLLNPSYIRLEFVEKGLKEFAKKFEAARRQPQSIYYESVLVYYMNAHITMNVAGFYTNLVVHLVQSHTSVANPS